MALALMSLGQNVFYVPMVGVETPNFETLQRDSSYTWIPQGRLNAPLALQYTGPGQDTFVIEGRLFPEFFGGISTLGSLRASGAAGKPLPLMRYYPATDATGKLVQGIEAEVLGDFVIVRVRSNEKHVGSSGVARMIEFSLELQAYGNDTPLSSSTTNPASQGTTESQALATGTPAQVTGSTTTPR